jgi:preprotein translocase subunit Sec61beta
VPNTTPDFESRNSPPAIEPVFIAAAALLTAVLLIIALLVAAS